MSKVKESFGSSRIQSNLLQQNCFVRDVTRKVDIQGSVPDFFESLDEVVTDKGIELKRSVEPYPITPQYVSSFADSSDYRKDPLQAISSGVNRQNLGDISDVQRVAALDFSDARALYERLKKQFDSKPAVDNAKRDVDNVKEDNNG